jgi:hypothetical protein
MIVEMPKGRAKTGHLGGIGLGGVTGTTNTIDNDSEVEHELFAEGNDATQEEKNQLCETSSWESNSDDADDDYTSEFYSRNNKDISPKRPMSDDDENQHAYRS